MFFSKIYGQLDNFWQKLAQAFQDALNFRSIYYYLVSLLLLQVLAWWQSVRIFSLATGDRLIMHYNINYGVDRIGIPSKIFYLPSLALLVILINLAILLFATKHPAQRLFHHLLLSASVIVAVFVNIGLMALYLVNF